MRALVSYFSHPSCDNMLENVCYLKKRRERISPATRARGEHAEGRRLRRARLSWNIVDLEHAAAFSPRATGGKTRPPPPWGERSRQ